MLRMLSRFLPSRRSRSQARRPAARPQARPFRPALETLEDRTVLSPVFLVAPSQATDSAHVANLNTAIKNAGSGGTIQVEPGAIGGTFTLQQSNTPFNAMGITIQGDPNVAASSLPLLNISFTTTTDAMGNPTSFAASGVTLQNLNLGTVIIGAFANGERILNSDVNSVLIQGGATGSSNNGNNLIQGNTIGSVLIDNVFATGFSANDQILNNTFNSGALFFGASGISVTNDSGVVIKGNIVNITGAQNNFGGPDGIMVLDSQSADIEANNVNINLDPSAVTATVPANSTVGIDIGWTGAFPVGATKGAVVQLNTVSTNNILGGTGLVVDARGADKDANVQVIVQGNDFHNNLTGATYLARNDGSAFGTTFGGPAQTGPAVSLGGNDFRGTNIAIAVVTPGGANLVNAGAQLDAQNNIFTTFTATPNVIVPPNGTTTGTINTSNPLTANQSFVQKLYEQLLGAVVDTGTLAGWVNILTSTSNSAAAQQLVAALFQYSTAGLGHLIDGLSMSLFGHPLANTGLRNIFVNELRAGTPLETVEGQLIGTPDYYTATGGNVLNTAFQQLFGQTANAQVSQALQLAQFQTGANGQPNGVNGVATALLQSSQARALATSQLFQSLLYRSPSSTELNSLVGFGGPLLNIELAILSSSGFFNNG